MTRLVGFLFLSAAACGGGGGGSGGGGGGSDQDLALTETFFVESEFNDLHLTMAPEDWDSVINDTRGDTYRNCSVQWKDVSVTNVGIRPSHESNRFPGNPKMALSLDFNVFVPRQKFQGLKKLKLDGLGDDTSMIRDRVAYYFFRQRIAAPRAVHVRLFVNGESRGLYEAEERVDSVMVDYNFGGDTGNLYKLLDSGGDQYLYQGTSPSLYMPFPWEWKTHEGEGDHSDVPNFLNVLNNNPSQLDSVFDMDRFLEYLAVEAIGADYDGFANPNSPVNHYQYRPKDSSQFRTIPWDVDSMWSDTPDRGIFQDFEKWKLTQLVMTDPTLRARYVAKIRALMQVITPAAVAARVDFVFAQIRQAGLADPFKPWTNDEFEGDVQWIKEFAQLRHDNLTMQLALEP